MTPGISFLSHAIELRVTKPEKEVGTANDRSSPTPRILISNIVVGQILEDKIKVM